MSPLTYWRCQSPLGASGVATPRLSFIEGSLRYPRVGGSQDRQIPHILCDPVRRETRRWAGGALAVPRYWTAAHHLLHSSHGGATTLADLAASLMQPYQELSSEIGVGCELRSRMTRFVGTAG